MASQMVRILDGNTFVVCDERGDIEASPTEPTGLFSFDMRFLSQWVMTVNGERLNSLSIDDLQYFESRFFLVPGTGTVYIDAKLSVIRQRAVGHGFHEELTVLNHEADAGRPRGPDRGRERLRRPVRGQGRAQEGRAPTRATVEDGQLRLAYQREIVPQRDAHLRRPRPPRSTSTGLTFTLTIEPHGRWTTDLDVTTTRAAARRAPTTEPKYERGRKHARPNMERSLDKWLADAPRLECDWEPLGADLQAEPRRPRRAALLAAGRRRPEPARRRACRGS